jgi:hypothetical protein
VTATKPKTVQLEFTAATRSDERSLSGAGAHGDYLFVAPDEGVSIVRMRRKNTLDYDDAKVCPVDALVHVPRAAGGEIDLEGMEARSPAPCAATSSRCSTASAYTATSGSASPRPCSQHTQLLHSTSALLYPVFHKGENWRLRPTVVSWSDAVAVASADQAAVPSGSWSSTPPAPRPAHGATCRARFPAQTSSTVGDADVGTCTTV